MLRVIQGAVSNSGEDFADDEERVAVESVGRCAGHDDGACKMEGRKNDGEGGTTVFVNAVAERDAEEGVHLVGRRKGGVEFISVVRETERKKIGEYV